ncbi:MAG: TIGR01777 family oxidoreductase [Emticicia sp.]|uniref:TIGR01777 family oxidoreductase n=1 Tax=Emticicia sp. TaxID=1930953 RepID=UPI003BA44854
MKIVIAGGSGFLGNALEKYLIEKKHQVIILSRNQTKQNQVYWDANSLGNWVSELENADVLINMTGKSVDCRYNEGNRKQILASRINSTNVLQEAIDKCKCPPKVWLNASSATIYIHAETQLMDEEKGIIGDDFSMNICKAWEAAFFKKENTNVRKVALRTSIVLGNDGGAFQKIKAISRLGLGGKQGHGEQMMSWIHIEDFCRAVEYIINDESIVGAINITAPTPVKNTDFMQQLRKLMSIPFGLSSPVFILELAAIFIGTETELLLKSRNVYPKKLLESGFSFKFPNHTSAIQNLLA